MPYPMHSLSWNTRGTDGIDYSGGSTIVRIAEHDVVEVGIYLISNKVSEVVLIKEVIFTALKLVTYQSPPSNLKHISGVRLYNAPFA